MGRRSSAFDRFMASTAIDYERWHDGVGYDLEALAGLGDDERAEAEAWLLARAGRDWRDLEGLLAIGTERAHAAVVEQLRDGMIELRLAAARRLPPDPADPALEADREAAIVAGLAEATVLDGLTTVLDLAAEHRTPAVEDALIRATLRDDREMAIHAAALLAFLHGTAKEPFDWTRRPFFLEFGDPDSAVRRLAFERLCGEIGVDPRRFVGA